MELVSLFRDLTIGWGDLLTGWSLWDVEYVGRSPGGGDEEESEMGESAGEEDVDQSDVMDDDLEEGGGLSIGGPEGQGL